MNLAKNITIIALKQQVETVVKYICCKVHMYIKLQTRFCFTNSLKVLSKENYNGKHLKDVIKVSNIHSYQL